MTMNYSETAEFTRDFKRLLKKTLNAVNQHGETFHSIDKEKKVKSTETTIAEPKTTISASTTTEKKSRKKSESKVITTTTMQSTPKKPAPAAKKIMAKSVAAPALVKTTININQDDDEDEDEEEEEEEDEEEDEK